MEGGDVNKGEAVTDRRLQGGKIAGTDVVGSVTVEPGQTSGIGSSVE